MKPGDHPEFFRFPAPAGRSRESSIVLDGQGTFFHDGEPVRRASMAEAFSQWIRRHPDDGRYILSNGYDWTYFSVHDVPFFVRSVEIDDDQVWLHLSDGSREALTSSHPKKDANQQDTHYSSAKDGQKSEVDRPRPNGAVDEVPISRRELTAEGLRVGRGDALYCSVKDGNYEARFTPAAQVALEPLLEEVDGGYFLRLGNKLVPIATRSE